VNVCYNPMQQLNWDQDLLSSDVLYKHQKNLAIVHRKTTKTMILPAMDTVFNVLLNKEADGSIREVSMSAIKGNMSYLDIPMSGRYFRKVADDKTWMTVVHEINFKDKQLPPEVVLVYHKHHAY
jgi:hypothetical protein